MTVLAQRRAQGTPGGMPASKTRFATGHPFEPPRAGMRKRWLLGHLRLQLKTFGALPHGIFTKRETRKEPIPQELVMKRVRELGTTAMSADFIRPPGMGKTSGLLPLMRT
jgi:hypothetical protein